MEGLPDSVVVLTTKKDMFGNIVWEDNGCNVPQIEVT